MFNLPNSLTILRVILIPIFVVLFYLPTSSSNFFATIVFVVAALTDLLDGYLARKLKQTTKFGAFLDPVADKIIVCTALVLIVEYFSVKQALYFEKINLLITIPSIVIISREIVVSALREWMAEIGKRATVAVSWIGKWKTTIQLVSISGLVWRYNHLMVYLSIALLIVATILTIWSMVSYLSAAVRTMQEDHQKALNSTKSEHASQVKESSIKDSAKSEKITITPNEAVNFVNEKNIADNSSQPKLDKQNSDENNEVKNVENNDATNIKKSD